MAERPCPEYFGTNPCLKPRGHSGEHGRPVLYSRSTMQEDVFSISEGRVVIQWPAPLSAESIADLKDWLKIVERKITRSTASAENQPKGTLDE